VLVPDLTYRTAPHIFWLSFLATQAAVFGLLWAYGRHFAQRWRRDQEFELPVPAYSAISTSAPAIVPENPAAPKAHYDVFATPKWFVGNPIEWLTLREMSMHSGGIVWTIGAIVCAIFSFTPISLFYSFLFSAGLVIFLCIASARTFAVARQSNSMELLITTPVGVEGMIQGHMAALSKMFAVPGAIMVLTFLVYLLFHDLDSGPFRSDGFGWYLLVGFAMLLFATPWIGMWMGLRCKTPARAILATIALVVILPRFGGCIGIDAFYFVIAWVVARHQVHSKFRQLLSHKPPSIIEDLRKSAL
jgi:hypothetical protein